MAKKKNIKPQDVSAEDMEYIDSKLSYSYKQEPAPFVNLDYSVKIKCKTESQKKFLNLLKDDSKQIVVGMGSAGSGKSWISLSYALSAIKSGKYKKVIAIIPTVTAGSRYLDLGLLPGDLQQKIDPFLTSDKETMVKILEQSGNYSCERIVDSLLRNNVLDYRPLAHIRGASWDNTFIYGAEIENLSLPELVLMMTRIGENSKLCLTGDPLQCDRPDILKKGIGRSGIEDAVKKLGDLPEFGEVIFTKDDIVRNQLITKILERLSTKEISL